MTEELRGVLQYAQNRARNVQGMQNKYTHKMAAVGERLISSIGQQQIQIDITHTNNKSCTTILAPMSNAQFLV